MDNTVIPFKLLGIGYSENPTSKRVFEVGEVTLFQDDPLSVDLTMVPEIPTATNDALESEEVVVVAVDSEDAEDSISS